jgi:hypothetical protein
MHMRKIRPITEKKTKLGLGYSSSGKALASKHEALAQCPAQLNE